MSGRSSSKRHAKPFDENPRMHDSRRRIRHRLPVVGRRNRADCRPARRRPDSSTSKSDTGSGSARRERCCPRAARTRRWRRVATRAKLQAKIGAFFIPGVGTADDLRAFRDLGGDFVRIGTDVSKSESAWEFVDLAVAGIRSRLQLHEDVRRAAVRDPAPRRSDCRTRRNDDMRGRQRRRHAARSGGRLRARAEGRPRRPGRLSRTQQPAARKREQPRRGTDTAPTVIDTTLLGMGRGGGNAQTETMLVVLEKAGYATGINPLEVAKIAERYVSPKPTRLKGRGRARADLRIRALPQRLHEACAGRRCRVRGAVPGSDSGGQPVRQGESVGGVDRRKRRRSSAGTAGSRFTFRSSSIGIGAERRGDSSRSCRVPRKAGSGGRPGDAHEQGDRPRGSAVSGRRRRRRAVPARPGEHRDDHGIRRARRPPAICRGCWTPRRKRSTGSSSTATRSCPDRRQSSRLARARVKPEQLLFYSDNQVWFDSGLDIVQRLEGGLTGKTRSAVRRRSARRLLRGRAAEDWRVRREFRTTWRSPVAPPSLVLGASQKRESIGDAIVERLPAGSALYDVGTRQPLVGRGEPRPFRAACGCTGSTTVPAFRVRLSVCSKPTTWSAS